MSRTIRYITNTAKHPARTGAFTVLAVLIAGTIAGSIFGYDAPARSFAQMIAPPTIVVTAPPPAPVVPIVIPLPIAIAPIVTPVPTVPVETPVTTDTNTNNSGSNDNTGSPAGSSDNSSSDDVVVTAPTQNANPTPAPPTTPVEIVVTAPAQENPHTTPCCEVVTPPTTGEIVVTAPNQENPHTTPCCEVVTPPTTSEIVVTAPTQENPHTTPCCEVVTVTPPTPPVGGNPHTTPCCDVIVPSIPIIPLTPIVPIVPVVPVVPVVPIIPSTPTPRCVALTLSSYSVASGAPVTITWKAENNDSITITDVGTLTGAEARSGSRVVTASASKAYKASVPGDENNPDCAKNLTVVPPVTLGTSCIYLRSNTDTITSSGQQVTLTYLASANSGPVTITNVTNNTVLRSTTDISGGIDVNPTETTTYHASVPSDLNNPLCTVTVKLDTTTGGGGGGGGGSGGGGGHGGSSHKPKVYFSSNSRVAPPLGEVYLSQIPYTGLDLGPAGTVVYWTMLVVWSLAAAYLVLFGAFPLMRRKLAAFGSSVGEALNGSQPAALLPEHAASAHALPVASVAVHTAPVAAPAQYVQRTAPAPAPRMEMTGEGFKRFATDGALTIDDIVKGLSRESGMQLAAEPAQASTEAYAPAHEAPAPAPIERQTLPAAPVARAEAPAAPVNQDVIGFIAAILAGERDAVFATIRQINQAGHDVEEFVSHTILALDDAYKARIDGTPVHADVKQVTAHCGTPFLERLVSSLTTAVDGSYSMGVTGIKLALTRALAVAQG